MTTLERPPVRYAISQPGYNQEVGRRLCILCDGIEQDRVIEYDCDAGTILRLKTGEDGLVLLNDKRDEAVRETIRGNVTVEWKD